MKKIFLGIGIISMLLGSCKKEKPLNVDLTKSITDSYTGNVTDEWLKTNFLDVYNMQVLYRFDSFKLPVDKYSTPVNEEKVKSTMELVRTGYIEPYIKVSNKNFFMPRVPKVFALYGSGMYREADHTAEAAGTAEAGRQINLFGLNDFDPSDKNQKINMLHTIHHEFTHILNQVIPLPVDYEGISNNYVGDNWTLESEADANEMGFISRYSRKNKMEDFAEMVSFLLVNGQDAFEIKILLTSNEAKEKLKKKEQMVVDYFAGYGIDFRALQKAVKDAI